MKKADLREADELVRAHKVMGRVRAGYTVEEAMKELNKEDTDATTPEPFCWILEFNDPDPQMDIEFQKEKPKGWPENKCYPLYKEEPPVTVIDNFIKQDPSSIPTTDEHNALLVEQIEELREALHPQVELNRKLVAEIDSLKFAAKGFIKDWMQKLRLVSELQAENERLRKDARRYQYLRINLHRLQSMRPNHAPKPEDLDSSIDEELKEQP